MKTLWIILTILLFGCSNHKEKSVALPANYKLNAKTQILVDSLSLIKYVSYSDKQSIRYDSLIQKASINDLIFLTNHKNPYLRSFSFLGLVHKNHPKVRDIFYSHKNDTAFITTGMYDMVGEETVASFMLQKLHPNSKSKFRFSKNEFKKLYSFIDSRNKKLKRKVEAKINWEDTIKKLKHLDLEYTQEFYWADSDDKDFEIKQRLVKKKVPFKNFDDNIIVTAYFEVNACHAHFPNMERKGDTVILKDQLLYKNPCDENFRVIHKINFVIFNQFSPKIKTVIIE